LILESQFVAIRQEHYYLQTATIDIFDVFSQPVSAYHVIERLVQRSRMEKKMVQDRREKPLLLIADDDPELMGILLKRLQDIECDIITAPDGIKALEGIREQRPDVVILDVMMPRKNGWEVCKSVRQDEELKGTGIIMLTGIGSSLNEMTSPLYGADEYLDKPFDFSELIFKIKRMLAGRK
jgi:CheY-like chemotaxis protein